MDDEADMLDWEEDNEPWADHDPADMPPRTSAYSNGDDDREDVVSLDGGEDYLYAAPSSASVSRRDSATRFSTSRASTGQLARTMTEESPSFTSISSLPANPNRSLETPSNSLGSTVGTNSNHASFTSTATSKTSTGSHRRILTVPSHPSLPAKPSEEITMAANAAVAAVAPPRTKGRRERDRDHNRDRDSAFAPTILTLPPRGKPRSMTADDIPPDWEIKISRSGGDIYYYNHKTGRTQWNRPTLSGVVTPPRPPKDLSSREIEDRNIGRPAGRDRGRARDSSRSRDQSQARRHSRRSRWPDESDDSWAGAGRGDNHNELTLEANPSVRSLPPRPSSPVDPSAVSHHTREERGRGGTPASDDWEARHWSPARSVSRERVARHPSPRGNRRGRARSPDQHRGYDARGPSVLATRHETFEDTTRNRSPVRQRSVTPDVNYPSRTSPSRILTSHQTPSPILRRNRSPAGSPRNSYRRSRSHSPANGHTRDPENLRRSDVVENYSERDIRVEEIVPPRPKRAPLPPQGIIFQNESRKMPLPPTGASLSGNHVPAGPRRDMPAGTPSGPRRPVKDATHPDFASQTRLPPSGPSRRANDLVGAPTGPRSRGPAPPLAQSTNSLRQRSPPPHLAASQDTRRSQMHAPMYEGVPKDLNLPEVLKRAVYGSVVIPPVTVKERQYEQSKRAANGWDYENGEPATVAARALSDVPYIATADDLEIDEAPKRSARIPPTFIDESTEEQLRAEALRRLIRSKVPDSLKRSAEPLADPLPAKAPRISESPNRHGLPPQGKRTASNSVPLPHMRTWGTGNSTPEPPAPPPPRVSRFSDAPPSNDVNIRPHGGVSRNSPEIPRVPRETTPPPPARPSLYSNRPSRQDVNPSPVQNRPQSRAPRSPEVSVTTNPTAAVTGPGSYEQQSALHPQRYQMLAQGPRPIPIDRDSARRRAMNVSLQTSTKARTQPSVLEQPPVPASNSNAQWPTRETERRTTPPPIQRRDTPTPPSSQATAPKAHPSRNSLLQRMSFSGREDGPPPSLDLGGLRDRISDVEASSSSWSRSGRDQADISMRSDDREGRDGRRDGGGDHWSDPGNDSAQNSGWGTGGSDRDGGGGGGSGAGRKRRTGKPRGRRFR